MIKREELAEAIAGIIPEGEAGNTLIETIMGLDKYPDPTDPGPDYVRKEEHERMRAEYNARIRRLFGLPRGSEDTGDGNDSATTDATGDGETTETMVTAEETVLTDTPHDTTDYSIEALFKRPEETKGD